MTINRHNYETFFLLYVDKELSAAERKAVDVFVQENPDLKMELILLQQTVIKADEIILDKKNWLYREEGITALQENLLLYGDDELTDADKKSVEVLLATDKKTMAEWTILQQTILQPDRSVVFADKQSLYRKEGGRVVGFKWWRVAAAAVLLGLILWTGVSVYNNNFQKGNGTKELVKENKIKPRQQKANTASNNTVVTTGTEEKSTTENTVSTKVQRNDNGTSEKINPFVVNSNKKNTITPKGNVAIQNSNTIKPNNNLPKPYFENINNKSGNETVTANVLNESNSNKNVSGDKTEVVTANPKENKTNTVIADVNTGKTDQNGTAIQVANKSTADEVNNNRYLNVDDGIQKRTALSGFLRKAKRVLERTTNLKTGDGIKIAAFEIALK